MFSVVKLQNIKAGWSILYLFGIYKIAEFLKKFNADMLDFNGKKFSSLAETLSLGHEEFSASLKTFPQAARSFQPV